MLILLLLIRLSYSLLMAVPKKKISKHDSRVRRSAWMTKQSRRLLNKLNLHACSQCGETKQGHVACTACGYYNGRQVIEVASPASKGTVVASESV